MISGFLALFLIAFPTAQPGVRVYDQVGILTPDQGQYVSRLCRDVDARTTAEIAVVIVPGLDGQSVDEYANTLFNQWGIGKRGSDNGVLLLVAPRQRRVRIEVGYGLEPLLPDGLCGEILDAQVIPYFKAGDMGGGTVAGVEAVAQILMQHPEDAHGVTGSVSRVLKNHQAQAQLLASLATLLSLLCGASLMFSGGFGLLLSERFALPAWWLRWLSAVRGGKRGLSFFHFRLVMIGGPVLTVLAAALAFSWATPYLEKFYLPGFLSFCVAIEAIADRPRRCPRCGAEAFFDPGITAYLNGGEIAEWRGSAAYYRVLKCSSCGMIEKRRSAAETRLRTCPTCGYHCLQHEVELVRFEKGPAYDTFLRELSEKSVTIGVARAWVRNIWFRNLQMAFFEETDVCTNDDCAFPARRSYVINESCPRCGASASAYRKEVLIKTEPTCDKKGSGTLEIACGACSLNEARDIVIPRLVKPSVMSGGGGGSDSGFSSSSDSSSSGGSSFGGGSSGGGGASRGW